MVRATTGDTPSTGEGNPIGYGTYPKEYAHDSANNIAKNYSFDQFNSLDEKDKQDKINQIQM